MQVTPHTPARSQIPLINGHTRGPHVEQLASSSEIPYTAWHGSEAICLELTWRVKLGEY